MKVVVQKFGGTCIETPESRELTAERIMEAKDRDLHPVVVVSAMGRAGTPYSTVELVNMVRHIDEKINPRDLDMLMSCGEIISTAAMAHLLRTKGYETIALTGGQAGLITDYYYGHARIIRIEAEYLLECLQAGHMVFVAGFQGISEQHAITTLGEGGSDYTAVALSVIVEQTPKLPFGDDLELHPPLQIYKEVNGVMTANPKHFAVGSSPRTIPALTYDECASLAALGAEVLQHKAAQMAGKYRIPLTIRNFREANAPGTEISSQAKGSPPDQPCGIADIPNMLVFTVKTDSPRLAGQLHEVLDWDRLTHYELTGDSGVVRFAVKQEKYRDVEEIVGRVLADRELTGPVEAGGWALVSSVGEGLRGRIERCREECGRLLAGAGVEVFGTLQHDLSMSFLVREEQRQTAVRTLHSSLIGG